MKEFKGEGGGLPESFYCKCKRNQNRLVTCVEPALPGFVGPKSHSE